MRSLTILGSRAARLGAALAMTLAVSIAGPVVATAAARSVPSSTSSCHPSGDDTWQNNHNGRYLEIYQADTDPGNNVDSYTWNCTPTQLWVPVLDGVEYFHFPVQGNGSYDAWSFYNVNAYDHNVLLCLQDPSGTPDVRVYSEPCVYGDQQEFAQYPTSSGYYLMADYGQQICEQYTNSIDWAVEIANNYPNYGSDKCTWH